jgi:hypothetical protein
MLIINLGFFEIVLHKKKIVMSTNSAIAVDNAREKVQNESFGKAQGLSRCTKFQEMILEFGTCWS